MAARARALVARVPAALAILLLVAVGLRLALWLAYSPAILNLADAGEYVSAADGELFGGRDQDGRLPDLPARRCMRSRPRSSSRSRSST